MVPTRISRFNVTSILSWKYMILYENCIQYYFTDMNIYVASFTNMV